ncbi:hypothetical protein K431DRAFT_86193 [Polychaeton citri CBS 116435]|uniref:Uncharacterized protein n=1 Tax=Polychaeton citri CBS 116435 TaxID=1314669 RepID=A0A9P4Q534_9PEZI|nr:hypothetical protein K431DRAFT_86193 [Polychaeton citri CBS 116435]
MCPVHAASETGRASRLPGQDVAKDATAHTWESKEVVKGRSELDSSKRDHLPRGPRSEPMHNSRNVGFRRSRGRMIRGFFPCASAQWRWRSLKLIARLCPFLPAALYPSVPAQTAIQYSIVRGRAQYRWHHPPQWRVGLAVHTAQPGQRYSVPVYATVSRAADRDSTYCAVLH